MTKQEFLTALGVTELSPRLDRLYAECMAAMKGEGTGFLSPAFIDSLQNELDIFHEKLDFVKESAKRVCENPVLSRLAFLLTKAFDKSHGNEIIALDELPVVSAEVATVDYEMAVFLSQFAFTPELKLYYRWRGVPDRVISAMLTECFEESLIASETSLGRQGFDIARFFERNQHYIDHSVLNERIKG